MGLKVRWGAFSPKMRSSLLGEEWACRWEGWLRVSLSRWKAR